jgi:hypothetical protein
LTLITGPLKDFEKRGISRDGTQECVIPTDVIDGLLREGHPPLVSPAEKLLMQTTIAQSHTTALAVLLWYCIYWFIRT